MELEREGERTVYFLGPLASGIEVDCEGRCVQVITPQSPMGRQIIGSKERARLKIRIGRTDDSYGIVTVS